MRIAMIGTRGVPAQYGGFETAVEEIGRRLADSGDDVTVYCRGATEPRPTTYLGMRLVHLPAVHHKALETLSHTGISVAHAVTRARFDAALVFNAANSVFSPLLRARRIPFAVHVDGLEWQRAKWGGAGRRYYRMAESLAVRWADALIADAQGIADYYTDEFGTSTELLSYGAPIQGEPTHIHLGAVQVDPGRYHLVVARFEPENHVDLIVEAYRNSHAKLPLVVIGSAPYADEYTQRIQQAADGDERIRLIGAVWDQDLLDELYANALTYVHGHSVGGTNPSLLRAMGAGSAVLAFDVSFNRDVAGEHGLYFAGSDRLARQFEEAEAHREAFYARGEHLRERARTTYRWDDVAAGYANLLQRLVDGETNRGSASGQRAGRQAVRRVGHVPA